MNQRAFDRTVGRLMIGMTYLAVALLAIGVVLMIANGISPLATAPAFDPATLPDELRDGEPSGFLWLGLILVIATPIVRVAFSSIGFARQGAWRMVWIGLGILLVIAAGIATSLLVRS